MAYDQTLAARIDELVKGKKKFEAKKMFGGIGYMLNGNMCVGVYKNDLIIRCDPAEIDKFLSQKNVRPFDITGKPMKGWLLISAEGTKGIDLQKWFDKSFSFVQTLPA